MFTTIMKGYDDFEMAKLRANEIGREDEKIFEFSEGTWQEVEIPKGFHYVEGTSNNGILILDDRNNQYVRVPAGWTCEGKYTRGFWISRYEISLDSSLMPCSIPNVYPKVNVDYNEACEISQKVKNGFIPSGVEYNRLCMWLVESYAASFDQVFVKGSGLGNYTDTLVKTGAKANWMKNRIDNLWGNTFIWTDEKDLLYEHKMVIRGGPAINFITKECYPLSCRGSMPREYKNDNVSLRIVIHDEVQNDDD